MNSIFSSFDFLCAELFGMKVKAAHLPPAASTVAGGGGGGDPPPLRRGEGAPDVPRTGSEGENVTEQKQKPKQKGSFPRFAVELDGIHCFETIVPH